MEEKDKKNNLQADCSSSGDDSLAGDLAPPSVPSNTNDEQNREMPSSSAAGEEDLFAADQESLITYKSPRNNGHKDHFSG